MTTVLDEHSLSNVELVVLARLSSRNAPKNEDLAEAVKLYAWPTEPHVNDQPESVLQRLTDCGLATHARKLTDKGRHLLSKICGLDASVTWATIRDQHLPALALELRPASAETQAVLHSAQATAVELLKRNFGITPAATLNDVADSLLAALLGLDALSKPLTMEVLRAHALGLKIAAKPVTGQLNLVSIVSQATLGSPATDKPSISRALARHWFYKVTTSRHAPAGPQPVAVAAAQSLLPLPPSSSDHAEPTQTRPRSGKTSDATPAPEPSERLLTVVREAIPRIGSDGRFGTEKVFVSAIWRRIERDPRLPGLSLDRFKQWLVTANRDQLVDLARADLVGAMDPKLVAESEIEDLGATFHFVVDRRTTTPGSERRAHAR